MTQFNPYLIREARAIFSRVYVDQETETAYIGSETATEGDRVRVYISGFEYEEPAIIRTNEELRDLVWDHSLPFC